MFSLLAYASTNVRLNRYPVRRISLYNHNITVWRETGTETQSTPNALNTASAGEL